MSAPDPLEVLTSMFDAPCLLPARRRTLWTMPCMVRPALSAVRHGAGDLLIKLLPISHRPRYYLVWVDSAWFDGEYAREQFYDELDSIWESLENEFGHRDSYSDARYHWPEVDDDGGCCWAIADPDEVLTWEKRRAWIPSYDDGRPAHLSSRKEQP